MNIVTTDYKYRPLLSWYELTDRERKQNIDYADEGYFIRYKGDILSLGDFMRFSVDFVSEPSFYSKKGKPFPSNYWHGSFGQSYWDGFLIRLSEDCESAIIGRYVTKG